MVRPRRVVRAADTAGTARFGGAWRVSVRAGAKRHMPGLHTARPLLQSQSCGIAISLAAKTSPTKNTAYITGPEYLRRPWLI